MFGNSVVRLSGQLAKRTVVTDKTIQIPLPEESGVRNLNLIYKPNGKPNVPANGRKGVYNLLTRQRPDLVHVAPLPSSDAPEIAAEIKQGHFDLVATGKPDFEVDNQLKYPFKDGAEKSTRDLQLLRLWKTGGYYTYNQTSGRINRVTDNSAGKYRSSEETGRKAGASAHQRVEKWNYNYNDPANFYRKYLVQDRIEDQLKHASQFIDPLRAPKSLPEVRHRKPLERSRSFTSDTRPDSFLERVNRGDISLQVTFCTLDVKLLHMRNLSN